MILSDAGDAFLLYETAAEGMPSPSDSDRGYHPGDIQSVSDDSVVITERSGHDNNTWPHTPIAVLPGPPPSADAIRKAIAGAAQSVVPTSPGQGWDFPQAAWADLLLGRAPRLTGGQLPRTGNDINDVCSALLDCEDSYVAVQGPPGTGKTSLATAIAGEIPDVPCYKLNAPEIVSGLSGQSEEKIRQIFKGVKAQAPAVVLIDELDCIAGKRENAGKDMEVRIVA